MSGIINKVKEVVSGHKDETTGTNAGTHSHNPAHGNRLDDRHENIGDNYKDNVLGGRDLDSSSAVQSNTGSEGLYGRERSEFGGSSNTGTGYGNTTTAGPHNSNIENKLDPRVDSDRSGSNTGYGSTGTGIGSTTGTSGYGSNTTGSNTYGSDTAGSYGHQHNSGIANKLDPTVASSGTTGEHHHHHGEHGHHHGTATGFGGPGTEFGTTPGTAGRFEEYTSTGTTGTTGTGYTSSGTGALGEAGYGSSGNYPEGSLGSNTGIGSTGLGSSGVGSTGHHHHGTSGTGTTGSNYGSEYDNTGSTGTGKPSLVDKLNPFKDSDKDGRKGVME